MRRKRAEIATSVASEHSANPIDPDRVYSVDAVADRSTLSRRTVERHAQDPSCPLRFTRAQGSRLVCSHEVLRAYLRWLTDAAKAV